MKRGSDLRLLFFGIDGADYGIVSRLINQGRLPNLSSLMKRGCFAPLKTVFPPHTATGWPSMVTGVNPGEHGIFQFWDTQDKNYASKISTTDDLHWEPLWKTLERHQLQVGLYNFPMSHPPKPIKGGYMITWPLSPTLHYSEPRSLVGELAKQGLHYHSDVVTMYRGQDDYLESVKKFIENRTKTSLYLLDNYPVDTFFVVYTEVDRVSHHYWGEQEWPAEAVLSVYEQVDQALGELVSKVGDDVLVVVASDHGFGHCRANLNVHHCLRQHGLLELTSESDGLNLEESDYLKGAAKADTQWFVSDGQTIDWSKTKVYMPTPGCFGLNLNLKGRQSQGIVEKGPEVDAIFDRLRLIFNEWFKVVPREEVYSGENVELAPDFILLPKVWDIMPHPSLADELWSTPSQQAIHRMDGVFFAVGPGIPSVDGCDKFSIMDVAPTVLSQLGLPVQKGVEGRGRFIEEGQISFEQRTHFKSTSKEDLTKDEIEKMESQLENLGYL